MLYGGATWIGSPNTGGPIGKVRLIVVHVEEGTEAGTNQWFQNPAAQVSAHFGVAEDGSVFQFVDTDVVAWAEADYNGVAISIEHEGNSGDSLTAEQIAADRALLAWISANYSVPLVRCTDPAGYGVIGHGELGVAGGNHPDCPGQPILDQIPLLLSTPSITRSPSMSTADVAVRPDGSGVDVVGINAADGRIYWQGNVPVTVQGDWEPIDTHMAPGAGPQPVQARSVEVMWFDSDTMFVFFVGVDRILWAAAMHPSAGWKFGAWAQGPGSLALPSVDSITPPATKT